MVGDLVAVGLVVLFVILGVILMRGKGAFLIAGYNTSTKEEKAKYNEKALCRFMGKIMIGCAAVWAAFFLSQKFSITWLNTVSIVVFIALIVFALIYANTGNRFKK